MIRIQRLKEPKITSGPKLEPGKVMKIKGIAIKNLNDFDVHVEEFERPSPKAVKAPAEEAPKKVLKKKKKKTKKAANA